MSADTLTPNGYHLDRNEGCVVIDIPSLFYKKYGPPKCSGGPRENVGTGEYYDRLSEAQLPELR